MANVNGPSVGTGTGAPPTLADEPLLGEEEAVDGHAGGEGHQRDLQAAGADGGQTDDGAGDQSDDRPPAGSR